MNKQIILASTSEYRKTLLEKTGLSFSCQKPDYEEESVKNDLRSNWASSKEIAETLALGKALSLQSQNSIVIAGDQLAHIDNHILGKPGSYGKAFDQLSQLNGKTHELVTATVILWGNEILKNTNVTLLKMKSLSSQEIKRYLKLDEPFDCSGSYKIESFGISLFEKIETDDFTAIQGLPLIWLTNTFKGKGYELFKR